MGHCIDRRKWAVLELWVAPRWPLFQVVSGSRTVANQIIFYLALLSHFPDERATVQPPAWTSRSAGGFSLRERFETAALHYRSGSDCVRYPRDGPTFELAGPGSTCPARGRDGN
jgi:hypothetical protein